MKLFDTHVFNQDLRQEVLRQCHLAVTNPFSNDLMLRLQDPEYGVGNVKIVIFIHCAYLFCSLLYSSIEVLVQMKVFAYIFQGD